MKFYNYDAALSTLADSEAIADSIKLNKGISDKALEEVDATTKKILGNRKNGPKKPKKVKAELSEALFNNYD